MERVEISRADFENQFGLKPEPSAMGMIFCTPTGAPLREYVFTDEDEPDTSVREIAELERIYSLT